MIDLAVAVVIGAAFSGIINSLVADIIMPGISYVVSAAKETANKTQEAVASATNAAGLTTKPSTAPATEPGTQPATAPSAAAPEPVAAAVGAMSGSPELYAKIGAMEAQIADMKKAADDAAKAEAKKKSEKAVEFDWTIGRFKIGDFVGEIINFLLIAAAVFFVIVKLLGSVMKKAGGTPAPSEPTTRECPMCLSVIPIKAKRCPQCTSDVTVPV